MPQLLTENDAADVLGVSPRTLANWRSRGGGPHFVRLNGKAIRYRASDLDDFIEKNIQSHTSEYDDDDGDFDEEYED